MLKISSFGEKPKTGPAAIIDWAIYGWANFFQSLAAGPILAGPSGWAIFWLGQFCWTGVIDWPSHNWPKMAAAGRAKWAFNQH